MRIAHVVNTTDIGGVEVLVAHLCRAFRELGHDLSVHCLSAEGLVAEQLRGEGIQVYSYPNSSTASRIPLLARVFRDTRPDAVHCHNIAATVAGAPAARLANVRTVITTRHSLVAPPHDLRSEILYSLAARLCNNVVGICEATCRNLLTLPVAPKRKIICVYNGAVRPRINKGVLPRRTGFTWVHVSRLAPVKDQQTLLRAFAIAHNRRHDMALWVVGDGPMRPHLEHLACELEISTRVVFCGEQQNVGSYLQAANGFVMSSVSEGLPVALLEAMSAGLPAVVTNVGGMSEVVSMAECGAIVPRRNPQRLAEELCRLAADPLTAAQRGARARACYETRFAFERMAENYLKIYQQP